MKKLFCSFFVSLSLTNFAHADVDFTIQGRKYFNCAWVRESMQLVTVNECGKNDLSICSGNLACQYSDSTDAGSSTVRVICEANDDRSCPLPGECWRDKPGSISGFTFKPEIKSRKSSFTGSEQFRQHTPQATNSTSTVHKRK
jgi:hypothetical protein